MPTDVIMPKLGLTMETGTVQRWLAAEGQVVEAGAALLEIETDKVVVEVEAPASGSLGVLLVQELETVPIGTLLARIYAPGEHRTDAEANRREESEQHGLPTTARQSPNKRFGPPPVQEENEESVADILAGEHGVPGDFRTADRERRIFSSPRARRRAREAGLDWHAVQGSGPMGRIIERDVLRAVAQAASPAVLAGPRPLESTFALDDVTWEAPTLIQRIASARLESSFSSAPHFYLSAEARADELLLLRERLLPAVERRAGVQLTVTDLLVKIAAVALVEHRRANAFWDAAMGGRIGLHRGIHIGIAVSTDEGLIVPVLRNADGMGLAQVAAERNRLVEKARVGNLLPGDTEESTFTLIDLGLYRVDVFQAILNPPQSAVLSVGRIAERPVAIQGQLRACPTTVVTLSCDHRVLDGMLGAQFLDRLVELIEEPYGLIA